MIPRKILIVEDQFIEASDLKQILERAGHKVCGFAASVKTARERIRTENPEFVLLDIFLKGEETGIDLAHQLRDSNTPFIYLSANSDQATLEAARATQPYGFLVKPFRERDILATLDIAIYRHSHDLGWRSRQEKLLRSLLGGVANAGGNARQKSVQLARALLSFIPFDHLLIDIQRKGDTRRLSYCCRRVDFDECASLSLEELVTATQTGSERLDLPLPSTRSAKIAMAFFASQRNGFDREHRSLLQAMQDTFANIVASIADAPENSNGPDQAPANKANLFPGIIGKSPEILHVLDEINKVAPFDSAVLITGETGTGKERLVDAIHRLSPRKDKPLIKVNCAAIPAELIESELFGHEKGAFTGAMDRRIGKFELAQGGTIFLDEIGEIPGEIQVRLLRVLQEKEIERVGGAATIRIDVRVVAATNRDLYKEMAEGRFRIDLFYRIHVFPIHIPPLRDRKDDIRPLAEHFLTHFSGKFGRGTKTFSAKALRQLSGYPWPGNIRELEHIIERHVLSSPSETIDHIDLPEASHTRTEQTVPNVKTIEEMEKTHILEVLRKCHGKISGSGGAAEMLQIPPTTLTYKIKKLGIVWQYS
jgi:DNA-binding NtrC family response regulator